jgi:hypothetical protein
MLFEQIRGGEEQNTEQHSCSSSPYIKSTGSNEIVMDSKSNKKPLRKFVVFSKHCYTLTRNVILLCLVLDSGLDYLAPYETSLTSWKAHSAQTPFRQLLKNFWTPKQVLVLKTRRA